MIHGRPSSAYAALLAAVFVISHLVAPPVEAQDTWANSVVLIDGRGEVTVAAEPSPIMLPCPRTDFQQVEFSWSAEHVFVEMNLDDLSFPCGPSPTFQLYDYVLEFRTAYWDEVEFQLVVAAGLDDVSISTAEGVLMKHDSEGNVILVAWVYPLAGIVEETSTLWMHLERRLVDLPYVDAWVWSGAANCAPVACYRAVPLLGDRVPDAGHVSISG